MVFKALRLGEIIERRREGVLPEQRSPTFKGNNRADESREVAGECEDLETK